MSVGTMTALRLLLAGAVGAGCLLVNEGFVLTRTGPMISEASAIRGRPLTPMSYAGVARRTTRRAVAYGGAYYRRPVVVAPRSVVVRPGCVQAVDAYGRIYMRCY